MRTRKKNAIQIYNQVLLKLADVVIRSSYVLEILDIEARYIILSMP